MNFTQARQTILDDPLGQTHTNGEMTDLYQLYFGRAPTAEELFVWRGLIRGGADFDQATDTLMLDSGSVGHVARAGGTSNAETFTYGSSANLLIDHFDPAADKIDLRGSAFAGMNPLDGHAVQVQGLDGTYDVLITLDATHHILLNDVALAQVNPADFVI